MREAYAGGVAPGTRVSVHLRGVPLKFQEIQSRPLAMFSLLRHEHKRTACNYSILVSSEHEAPIRSKTEMIVQCGPRRMVINPLFSQAGNTPNNVHKFDRYLHPGHSAIASFIGPLTWGNVPLLYFERTTTQTDPEDLTATPTTSLRLIGTGTSLPPSTNRIIAKRVILTGHPYKINKRTQWLHQGVSGYARILQVYFRWQDQPHGCRCSQPVQESMAKGCENVEGRGGSLSLNVDVNFMMHDWAGNKGR
jgi:pre-rRNA-processing protein TSR1